MRLLRVEAKNVFSIEQLTLVLANQGLLLIAGENGVGKSSLANKSIVWGLFGSTAGGITADDVINRNSTAKKMGSSRANSTIACPLSFRSLDFSVIS